MPGRALFLLQDVRLPTLLSFLSSKQAGAAPCVCPSVRLSAAPGSLGSRGGTSCPVQSHFTALQSEAWRVKGAGGCPRSGGCVGAGGISFKRPGWELAKNLLPPQGLGWTQGVKDLRNSARVSKAQTSLGSASKAVKQSPAPQGQPRATRPRGIQQGDARSGQALCATVTSRHSAW